MGLNQMAAMLSTEGLKTFVWPTETRSRTFQIEALGTKSIVYSQYGRRTNKAHCVTKGKILLLSCGF